MEEKQEDEEFIEAEEDQEAITEDIAEQIKTIFGKDLSEDFTNRAVSIFEATTGKLILFPSSAQHMVPQVQGEETRISLSFNTFPVGMIGEEVDLTGLRLEA